MFYDIVISVQSGVKYTTNLIGCAMTLTKIYFKTHTHILKHITQIVYIHTLKQYSQIHSHQ